MSGGVVGEYLGAERLVWKCYCDRVQTASLYTMNSVSELHYLLICCPFNYHSVCCVVNWREILALYRLEFWDTPRTKTKQQQTKTTTTTTKPKLVPPLPGWFRCSQRKNSIGIYLSTDSFDLNKTRHAKLLSFEKRIFQPACPQCPSAAWMWTNEHSNSCWRSFWPCLSIPYFNIYIFRY